MVGIPNFNNAVIFTVLSLEKNTYNQCFFLNIDIKVPVVVFVEVFKSRPTWWVYEMILHPIAPCHQFGYNYISTSVLCSLDTG